MTRESYQALERIVTLCEASECMTARQTRIYDLALEGLGYVSCQRREMLQQWIQKLRDQTAERRAQRALAAAPQGVAP